MMQHWKRFRPAGLAATWRQSLRAADPKRLRRATTLGLSLIVGGLAIGAQRPPQCVVSVQPPPGPSQTAARGQIAADRQPAPLPRQVDQPQRYRVRADSDSLRRLQQQLARRSQQRAVRKPDAYYAAAWRRDAAAYYLRRARAELIEPIPAPASLADRVVPASFRRDGQQEQRRAAVHRDIAQWQAQWQRAQQAFDQVAAGLPGAAPRAAAPAVSIGPLLAAGPTASESLALVALAITAGWGYYRISQPGPPAILLQTRRKVIARPAWYRDSPGRHHQNLKRLDQLAWVTLVLGLWMWLA
ncbi:hypothetical protein [Roseimaritima sediminicola]|uniref:hypothetical protein n=1 Tax=Roseimaritima sediminicola TaxID=2662066 RepID=UPI0012983273|nr:hypothetical protein [Roseimaritima sediminicola]